MDIPKRSESGQIRLNYREIREILFKTVWIWSKRSGFGQNGRDGQIGPQHLRLNNPSYECLLVVLNIYELLFCTMVV